VKLNTHMLIIFPFFEPTNAQITNKIWYLCIAFKHGVEWAHNKCTGCYVSIIYHIKLRVKHSNCEK